MTQDNKDAALELEFSAWLEKPQPAGMSAEEWNAARLKLAFIAGCNASRKPLEEDAETLFSTIKSQDIALEKLQQQLLATQEEVLRLSEAYQRVVEALIDSNCIMHEIQNEQFNQAQCQISLNQDLILNLPSLEAVERKKLEDEIAVLTHYSIRSDADALYTMIAERKAKLEKMK